MSSLRTTIWYQTYNNSNIKLERGISAVQNASVQPFNKIVNTPYEPHGNWQLMNIRKIIRSNQGTSYATTE